MYQITYYRDRAMTRRESDTDTISDAAIRTYPAPTGRETAEARHSDDARLTRYGYDGAWHPAPPAESC
jgi:hypothetical protein